MKAEEDLDLLGFVEEREFSHSVRFGMAEAIAAARAINTTTSVNAQPVARLSLDQLLLPAEPLDYFTTLVISAEHAGFTRPLFTGAVTVASPSEGGIDVEALGASLLAEQVVASFAANGVPAAEIVHFLTRSAGMREEQLRIEGLAELPLEMFEVLAPVEGISVQERLRLGQVTLLPMSIVQPRLEGKQGPFATRKPTAAYAIAYVLARRMLDAEERGLRQIDEGLAWLVTRARYGTALLPDSTPQRFSRAEALTRPRRAPVVLVRALGSQRRWTHETTNPENEDLLALTSRHPFMAHSESLAEQSDQTKQAILALARATAEPDALARVAALWEAIEFFVGSYQPPKLFSKAERKQIIASLPDGLSAEQCYRVERLVNEQLNELPLRRRLEDVLDQERIPHTDDEVKTLFGLRSTRNDAVHGRARAAPAIEDLQQATAFVARLLVHRVWSGRRIDKKSSHPASRRRDGERLNAQLPDLEKRHRWRFRIGDVFNPDDPLARFIVAVGTALNDNLLSNTLFVESNEAYEHIYFFNLASSHLYEAAETFLQAEREWQPVREFIATLEEERQAEFARVTALARPDAPWPGPRLKAIRNSFFHYIRLDQAQVQSNRLALMEGLRAAADREGLLIIESGGVLSGIRALFADEIAVQTAANDWDEGEFERLAGALASLQADLNRFAQSAIGRLLRNQPKGIVAYEEVEGEE